MIPDWKSDKGNQLGTDIATFVLKHKKELESSTLFGMDTFGITTETTPQLSL